MIIEVITTVKSENAINLAFAKKIHFKRKKTGNWGL